MYIEEIDMLEGVEDEEVDGYLDENPRVMSLFEIDVIEIANSYVKPTAVEGDIPSKIRKIS